MGGKNKYISFGGFEIKYLIFILGTFILLFIGRTGYSLYLDGEQNDNNKLLKTFLKYIGFALCIIGEIIRRKKNFKKKVNDKNLPKKSDICIKIKKEETKHLITTKDIIFIIIVALAHLGDEFLAITIKAILNQSAIVVDEGYNTIEFIFLFLTSFYIFKLPYYRHQKISILLIIFCEILRIIIKFLSENEIDTERLIGSFIQMFRAFIDSVFIGYLKVLMEDKFFSPYKALYIFGFINGLLVLILYFIFTYMPSKKSNFFSQKYNNEYYYDNLYSIFYEYTFIKLFGLFLYMIGLTTSYVLFSFIVNDFTICHIFIYYQIYVLFNNITRKEKNLVFIIITSVVEIFITLVFLEIIILHCFKLDKNVKMNIIERAELDANCSFERNDSFDNDNDNEHITKNDNNDEIIKKTYSIKMVPLKLINSGINE